MFSIIPFDLQINIVERLPGKNIIRFTAVTKSWYSTIKSSGLFKPHHNLSKSEVTNSEQDSCILFMPDEVTNGCENCCFLLSEDSLVFRETLKYNFTGNKTGNKIYFSKVGSCCNGVICLTRCEGVYGNELFLFNPSIRKLRPIPSSFLADQRKKSSHRVSCYVGFGYDETSDDYKVIRLYGIYECRERDSGIDKQKGFEYDVKLETEVYNLRSNYWKRVEAIDHGYSNGIPVTINNASYCLFRTDDESHMSIITFDFSAEVFREIPLPLDSEPEVTFLLTYKGSLAILVVNEEDAEDELEEEEEGNDSEEEEKAIVTIWILKYDGEESWNEEFTRVIPRSCYQSVEFTKTGKLIFWKTESDLALWDPETGHVVDVDEFYDNECIVVKDYVESLVLL